MFNPWSKRNSNYQNNSNENNQTDRSHFDSGAYEFTKIILNWSENELKTPRKLIRLQSRREKKITYSAIDLDFADMFFMQGPYNQNNLTDEYYESFKSHILEEARAVIAAGLESLSEDKIFELAPRKFSAPPKNPSNPRTIKAKGNLPKDTEGRSCLVLLLIIGEKKLLALCTEEGINTGDLSIKLRHSENLANYDQFKVKQKWTAYVLGSLISHQRMYEVCTIKPKVSFLDSIITGELNSWPVLRTQHSSTVLNESQTNAATKFLKAKEGLYLLQGPPGTGKTTTIVEILKSMVDKEQRILLCAPSNKAVQVIASRCLEKYPEISMALTGVESKLAPNLREIFIHDWNILIADKFANLKDQLLSTLNLQSIFIVYNKKQLLDECIEELKQNFSTLIISLKQNAPDFYNEIRQVIVNFRKEFRDYSAFLTETYEALDMKDKISIIDYYTSKDSKKKISSSNFTLCENSDNYLQTIHRYLNNIIETLKSAELERELLNTAQIVFCTLSIAGRKMMQEIDKFNNLIIDEAAQSVEAETLIAFSLIAPGSSKCLLVGDINQLPATVISPTAAQNRFDWSMMWRLINRCKQNYQMLTTQYRMHPEICQWPSNQFYEGSLENDSSILKRTTPYKMQKNLLFSPYSFIDISGQEKHDGHSYTNLKEAYAIIDTIKYFKSKHIGSIEQHIGVITFYAGQANLIKDLIKQKNLGSVKVSTVDGFQGDENDIIIISFVRANPKAKIGFLNDFRRLNVAITRAKHNLILFGNIKTLEPSENSDVAQLVADAKKRDIIYTEQQLNEITNSNNNNNNNNSNKPSNYKPQYFKPTPKPKLKKEINTDEKPTKQFAPQNKKK